MCGHACYSMYVEVRTTLGVSSLPPLLCGFQELTQRTQVARLVQQMPSPTSHPPSLLFLLHFISLFCVCLLLYTYMPWTSVEIRRQLAGLSSSPFTVLIWRTELRASTLAASILYLELVCFFEICSCWMAWLELCIEQTGLELKVNLLYLSKCWDYRCVIP